jgi:MazG family protein
MRFTFEDLVAVMARLRGPGGCPWDREQTHTSLAPYLLEEAHEVLEAIARGDTNALREELGDLLLQVVFHGQMAHEAGGFSAGDVVDGLVRKLIDRHPHVFGEMRPGAAGGNQASTPAEVLAQWHELKRREAPARAAFDGIPVSLPSLARAQKLVERARTNGITGWNLDDPQQAAAVAAERLQRVVAALFPDAGGGADAGGAGGRQDPAARARVLGDLLFAIVALAAMAGLDAESALREACQRFAHLASGVHPR